MELSQVLALHRVSEHRFELSGLRTGSVRDQMLRAQLLVEALCDAKPPLINATQRLIVAGGGVAGAVAALTAAARGVRVDVIERSDNLFTTQLGVNTRWLDPTEF